MHRLQTRGSQRQVSPEQTQHEEQGQTGPNQKPVQSQTEIHMVLLHGVRKCIVETDRFVKMCCNMGFRSEAPPATSESGAGRTCTCSHEHREEGEKAAGTGQRSGRVQQASSARCWKVISCVHSCVKRNSYSLTVRARA